MPVACSSRNVAGERAAKASVEAAGITSLQQASPSDFLLLRLLVCGAYYLHPAVKDALGYPGQQAQSRPRGGFGGEELVLKMMEKPKRYRDVS